MWILGRWNKKFDGGGSKKYNNLIRTKKKWSDIKGYIIFIHSLRCKFSYYGCFSLRCGKT